MEKDKIEFFHSMNEKELKYERARMKSKHDTDIQIEYVGSGYEYVDEYVGRYVPKCSYFVYVNSGTYRYFLSIPFE